IEDRRGVATDRRFVEVEVDAAEDDAAMRRGTRRRWRRRRWRRRRLGLPLRIEAAVPDQQADGGARQDAEPDPEGEVLALPLGLARRRRDAAAESAADHAAGDRAGDGAAAPTTVAVEPAAIRPRGAPGRARRQGDRGD